MADSIGSFDEQAQRDKVLAGFKGGPFNKNPVIYPALSFVDGHPIEVTEKNEAQGDIAGLGLGKTFSERAGKI